MEPFYNRLRPFRVAFQMARTILLGSIEYYRIFGAVPKLILIIINLKHLLRFSCSFVFLAFTSFSWFELNKYSVDDLLSQTAPIFAYTSSSHSQPSHAHIIFSSTQ